MNPARVVAVLLLATSVYCESLIVDTCNGKVRGKYVHDEKCEADYYAFKCIPYAKAPVGKLRFMAPQPAEDWPGVLKGASCAMCPQIDFMTKAFQGGEDCLHLSVYTPVDPENCDANNPLPVMVFITGGDWRFDSDDHYNPSFFMKKEVILVTFNYRIGPLGFLSTGDEIVPGNNGLKDQVKALEWVQENIRNFGGNPRKVTIVGSSVGGASVRYHMLSPMSKGLFVGGISHSSTELNTWSWHSTSEAVILFSRFANKVNCSSWYNEEAVDCLKRTSVQQLIEAEFNHFKQERVENALMSFKPVTEVPNTNAFLCKNPVDMLRDGEGNDVPMIIGLTENDGAYRYVEFLNEKVIDQVYENLDWILPRSSPSWRLEYGRKEEVLCRVRDFYMTEECKTDKDKRRTALIDYISDAWFLQGHNDLIRLHRETMSAPIYQYVLTYRGDYSFAAYKGYTKHDLGASLYDEELYLFDSEVFFHYDKRTKAHEAMIARITTLWSNFAKYQNPTPTSDDSCVWSPVCTSGNEYLDIMGPDEQVMKRKFHYERAEFWRNLACEFGTDRECCL